jgi:programmed cell death protein 4
MQKGFARLVDALPDVLLDVPEALELLSLFVARAVVDDILPPSSITKWCPGSPAAAAAAGEGAAGEGVVTAPTRPAANASAADILAQLRGRVEMHLAARHAAEKILRCWGTGGWLSWFGVYGLGPKAWNMLCRDSLFVLIGSKWVIWLGLGFRVQHKV